LAKLYKLQVVAEGVETAEQLNYLKTIACTLAQGYFLSRPLEWEDFLSVLKSDSATVNN